MKTSSKVAIASAAAAVATAITTVVLVTNDAAPEKLRRIGYAVPIVNDVARYRVNVLLNANAFVPPEVWATGRFPENVGADRQFPVAIWRLRGGVYERVATARVPAHQLGFANFSLTGTRAFEQGDVAIVEHTPALLVPYGDRPVTPFVSVIDNISGDPTTVSMARVSFSP